MVDNRGSATDAIYWAFWEDGWDDRTPEAQRVWFAWREHVCPDGETPCGFFTECDDYGPCDHECSLGRATGKPVLDLMMEGRENAAANRVSDYQKPE